jgi:hypothetical protein
MPSIMALPSLPIFLSLETDHKKFRGIEQSQSRRHTSFAPSKARKLPCSKKVSRVDDSRIRVSTWICHSFRDRVWVWLAMTTEPVTHHKSMAM